MTLVKRSEWPSLLSGSLLSDFFDGDRYFDADWLRKQSVPAVNVKELDKQYEIDIAAPGLSKNDFNITVDNGILIVSAEKQEEKEEKSNGKNYTRREFSYTSFARSFALPENANQESIDAHYENGILTLKINKKDHAKEAKKKSIEVK